MTRMVVTGAGPVGWTVAEQLVDQGHEVVVVTRSGSGPERDGVRRVRGDVSQPGALDVHLAGAEALFHCIHGSSYDATVWRRELLPTEQAVLASAARAGAVAVFPESLYAYDASSVMTETSSRTATGGKRGVRADLLAARAASPARTISVVASDFFGPRVRTAHAGERMVPTVLAGRTMRVLGRTDQAALLHLRARPGRRHDRRGPPGPARRRRHRPARPDPAAAHPARAGGGVRRGRRCRSQGLGHPGWVMRGMGAVHRPSRELAEMLYQVERPFVMDSSASERELDLRPTPLTEACAATVAWWRTQAPQPA